MMKLKKNQLHSDCFHSRKNIWLKIILTTVYQHPGLSKDVCDGQQDYGQIGKAEVALLGSLVGQVCFIITFPDVSLDKPPPAAATASP